MAPKSRDADSTKGSLRWISIRSTNDAGQLPNQLCASAAPAAAPFHIFGAEQHRDKESEPTCLLTEARVAELRRGC